MIKSLIDVIANPIYPTIVFILFFVFFLGVIYFVYFKWNDAEAESASQVPLHDGEIDHE